MGGSGLLGGGRAKILAFCWLGWVFDFHDLILFSFTKPAIGKDLDLAPDVVAWIEGATLLATALGGFLCGRLADRIGRRPAMILSILLFSAGALATALAAGPWSLLGARLVTGLGVGGEWGIGHAIVAEQWPDRQRDRVHGILQAGSPVAMALAAVTGCWLAPELGWRAVFAWSALPALLCLAGRWALPAAIDAVPRVRRAARELFAPELRRASCVLLAVLLLHMTGFWCVYAELPAALMRLHGVAPQDVGWFQIQVNAVHVVADVAFGWLALRFGRLRMFVLFCLVFALGQFALLAALPGVGGDFGRFTVAVALVGVGAGTWSCFGALFGRHYPRELRATAASTFYAAARGVQLLAKPGLAALFTATGSFAPALWVGAACAVGSAVLVRWLPRTEANRSATA
jgi:MFS family permease